MRHTKTYAIAALVSVVALIAFLVNARHGLTGSSDGADSAASGEGAVRDIKPGIHDYEFVARFLAHRELALAMEDDISAEKRKTIVFRENGIEATKVSAKKNMLLYMTSARFTILPIPLSFFSGGIISLNCPHPSRRKAK